MITVVLARKVETAIMYLSWYDCVATRIVHLAAVRTMSRVRAVDKTTECRKSFAVRRSPVRYHVEPDNVIVHVPNPDG